jgi:hypothetical protein
MNVYPNSTGDEDAESLRQRYVDANIGDFEKFSEALRRYGYPDQKSVYVFSQVAIPGGSEERDSLVTRVARATPSRHGKKVFDSVAIDHGGRRDGTREWYARLMLIFKPSRDSDAKELALVRYWKQDSRSAVCPETKFPRLHWDPLGGGVHVEDLGSILRVVHVAACWDNPERFLVNMHYR